LLEYKTDKIMFDLRLSKDNTALHINNTSILHRNGAMSHGG
jgi:hypothetical protein